MSTRVQQVLDTLQLLLLPLPARLDIRVQAKRPKTAIRLVTVILCRAKAIKVAFRSLNLPDQFRFGLAEGTNAVSFANSPDFLHLHFGPPFKQLSNGPHRLSLECVAE
jgi:hypothetical protein